MVSYPLPAAVCRAFWLSAFNVLFSALPKAILRPHPKLVSKAESGKVKSKRGGILKLTCEGNWTTDLGSSRKSFALT